MDWNTQQTDPNNQNTPYAQDVAPPPATHIDYTPYPQAATVTGYSTTTAPYITTTAGLGQAQGQSNTAPLHRCSPTTHYFTCKHEFACECGRTQCTVDTCLTEGV